MVLPNESKTPETFQTENNRMIFKPGRKYRTLRRGIIGPLFLDPRDKRWLENKGIGADGSLWTVDGGKRYGEVIEGDLSLVNDRLIPLIKIRLKE